MKIITIVARVLLGLAFTAGVTTFFVTPPPPPGMAGTFAAVYYGSHWALFVAAAQTAAGVLLLLDRFVPVALIVLAAFLYNSFAYHITMASAMLPLPVVATVLWLVVALPYRAAFAALFTTSARTG
jgi:putative oxidoreductase